MVQREDSFLREIMVLVLTGKYARAIECLENNFFHAQEGRSEIHDVYVDAHLLQGLQVLAQGNSQAALKHFQKAAEYPENLSVGRPKNDPRAPEIAYYTGQAFEALGKQDDALQCFRASAQQQETRRWPETRFFQALSMLKIGEEPAAKKIFQRPGGRGREAAGDPGFDRLLCQIRATGLAAQPACHRPLSHRTGIARPEHARRRGDRECKRGVCQSSRHGPEPAVGTVPGGCAAVRDACIQPFYLGAIYCFLGAFECLAKVFPF